MSTIGRATISAFVICKNEESKIRRCLKSVDWCDELVVVDSGSVDKTLDICREFTDKIFFREWTGFLDQKRYGLSLCTQEWVLNLDADEEVSPELKEEILLLLQQDKMADGYLINRVVFFLGKWWRKGGWYPEYRLRLCRRAKTTWGGTDPHEKALVEGTVKKLKGELRHYTYVDLAHQIRTLNSYSSQAAESAFKEGRKTSLIKVFINPIARFIKFYFLKKGFLEGIPGLIVAVNEAFYVYLKYLKLWEKGHRSEKS